MFEDINPIVLILVGVLLLLVVVGIVVFFKIKSLVKEIREDGQNLEIQEEKTYVKKVISEKEIEIDAKIDQDIHQVKLDDLKEVAKNSLLEIFSAIEKKDINELGKVSNLVATKITNTLKDQSVLKQSEYFENPQFEKVLATDLHRFDGYTSIVFLLKLDFIHYILQEEQIVDGSKDQRQQEIFELSFAHINDVDKINEEDLKVGLYGAKCPECGTEIFTLGTKFCPNCGESLIGLNTNSMILIDFLRK